MFITNADVSKNRLYITLKGAFNADEARLAAGRVVSEIKKLQPGFNVITDISMIKSSDVEAADELIKIQKLLIESGVNQIVRVVGQLIEQMVGKLQFDLASRESGIKAQTADTVAEADLLLDNLSRSPQDRLKVVSIRKEQ